MKAYADTGLLVSLYLPETTSAAAQAAVTRLGEPLPLIPLAVLELRNAFNFAIQRHRLTPAERDALWARFEQQQASGLFVPSPIPASEWQARARELSDRHTPAIAARTLDILHVAAALLLGAREFLSFDERQACMAAAEGLKVRP